MNTRIRKLLLQSTVDVKDEYGNWLNDQVDHEKFAALIVRECMRMCEVAELSLRTHGVREQSYGAADARRYISDWFEIEE